MVAYISEAQLKSYLRNEQSAAISALYGSIIEAASQAINTHCARTFVAVTEDQVATAKLFAPTGDDLLEIYDCTEITAVAESGTAVSSSVYQPEPVNGLDDTGRARPFDSIRRLDTCWIQTSAYPGKKSISVTAKWGWAAVPNEVSTACRIIASRIVDEQNTRGGLIITDDFAAAATRHLSGVRYMIDDLVSSRKGWFG